MMGTYAECLCMCCAHAVYRVCICERWGLHRNVKTDDLLHSRAGRLILHGLSKWGIVTTKMHQAVVPSA